MKKVKLRLMGIAVCLSMLLFIALEKGILPKIKKTPHTYTNKQIVEKATFGAGCFWCVEAIFERIEGVIDVRAGYTGGKMDNPTYEDVCRGQTGHVEVIQLDYDPQIISFNQLLDIFWKAHDPTTLNSQGADVGTQYRSAVF